MGRGPLAGALMVACLVTIALPSHAEPTKHQCLEATETSLQLRSKARLRDARAQLLVCASPSCPGEIQKECGRRLIDLDAAMPTMVFDVKDEHGADLADVRVLLDGAVLTERVSGAALSIDPGEHTLSFETKNRSPVRRNVVVREGEKNRIEHITFAAEPGAGNTRPDSTKTVTPTTVPEPRENRRVGGTQRMIGYVGGGAGLVSAGIGLALFAVASGKWEEAKSACSDAAQTCTSSLGVDAQKAAVDNANLGGVLLFAGLGVATAGVILVLTAPSGHERPVSVGVAPGGIILRGSF